MPVTINGSTGITSPGGDTSASLSTGLLTVTGSTVPANGMYLPAANTLSWATNSTRNMTLDSSGKLGIGTTSPQAYLHIQDGSGSANGTMWLGNSTYYGTIQHDSAVTGANIYTVATASGGGHIFKRGTTEQARIDSSGNLLVGTTSASAKMVVVQSGSGVALDVYGATTTAGTAVGIFTKALNSTATSNALVQFNINGGANGSGQINANGANAAAFGSYSDARLKENIFALPDQLANILALKPSEFDYKDGSGHQIGFIAQEMQEVYPDAVGEGENGMLTITGWSKTEARLVKALQELTQRLEALEAK
jgi:hypothetical protein